MGELKIGLILNQLTAAQLKPGIMLRHGIDKHIVLTYNTKSIIFRLTWRVTEMWIENFKKPE